MLQELPDGLLGGRLGASNRERHLSNWPPSGHAELKRSQRPRLAAQTGEGRVCELLKKLHLLRSSPRGIKTKMTLNAGPGFLLNDRKVLLPSKHSPELNKANF